MSTTCATYTGAFTDPVSNATPEEIICRGSDPNFVGNAFFEYWSQNNGTKCQSVLNNILYSATTTGLRQYDPTQLNRVQDDMNNAFAVYNQLYPITDVANPNFNVFQNTLLSTCKNSPGLCDKFLNNYCTNCTRTQIAADPLLQETCGCKTIPPTGYNITPECDPLCNKVNAIQNINTTTGATNLCNIDVCVIDDINILATKSTIGGGIIFSQACQNCKNSCTCIVSGTNVNGVLQQIGLTNTAQFNTYCNSNSTCYNKDPNTQQLTPIQCPKNPNFEFQQVPVAINNNTIWVILAIALVLIIGIVILFIYFKK